MLALGLLLTPSSLSMFASPSKTADAERVAWLKAGGKQSDVDAQIAANRARNLPSKKVGAYTPDKSPGCGLPLPSGLKVGKTTSMTLTRNEPVYNNASKTRTYRVHIPTNFDVNEPAMLVMDFHGYYDTEIIEETRAGMVPRSDDDNFIVVFPRGGGDSGEWPSWNGVGTVDSPGPKGRTCDLNRKYYGYYDCYKSCEQSVGCDVTAGCQCSSCYDDIGFIRDMMDLLEREVRILLLVKVHYLYYYDSMNHLLCPYNIYDDFLKALHRPQPHPRNGLLERRYDDVRPRVRPPRPHRLDRPRRLRCASWLQRGPLLPHLHHGVPWHR